jgi:RsiW-degrading membrane proteinase PrsW (M82 family)
MLILSVAIMGALVPTAIYILGVWWLDRYEKEPLWLLALAFLWGAGPAAFLSIAFEQIVAPTTTMLGTEGLTANLINVGIDAPLVEESLKGIALIGLVLIFYHEFDDVLDGIIYGAMIGFGFALTENIVGYFLPILNGEAMGAGVVFIFMRTVVFGTNHAFWTAMVGAAVGYARLAHRWRLRVLIPLGGWSLAVLFHSLHNIGTSMVQQGIWLPLGASLIINWGGLLLLLMVAALALRRECGWIEVGLVEEVDRGALTQPEYDLLRSSGQRLRVQWHAFRQGGRMASRAVGRYFQSATELAFAKRHQRADGTRERDATEIDRLQQELAIRRARAWSWIGSSRGETTDGQETPSDPGF